VSVSTESSRAKYSRAEYVDILRLRDGDICAYPDCDEVMDFTSTEENKSATIEHWIPQDYGKQNGWTMDEIWDLSNLKLMSKKCNSRKSNRVPNEDGSIPPRVIRKFRYRRDKRAGRPELCMECDNGHGLLIGEFCASCGCNAQRFPRSAKVRFADCEHEILWCWVCSITPDMRPSTIGTAMRQADSDELGEW
jgi:hypothetical protein